MFKPADHLEGLIINEWEIQGKITGQSSTGGFFSVGYKAVNRVNGINAFFKAMDYSGAFSAKSVPDTLKAMTDAYIFERDLLTKCKNQRLKHVVKIIDNGGYDIPSDYFPSESVVYPHIDYIVFELADRSMRAVIDLSEMLDYSWALRSLHNVAVAVDEMHKIQIAHQDIKPSNVLLFEKNNISKLGDVGRSSAIDTPAGHDDLLVAGDCTYSPFEQLYGYNHPDWKIRRYSCDMFMFGNLIMTYFNNVSITMAVIEKLPSSCMPNYWTDTYGAILPQIEVAFSECLEDFNRNIEDGLRYELIELIKQLCNPDLNKRGDLKNTGSISQFSMQRYISKLDLLSRRYEYQLKKVII